MPRRIIRGLPCPSFLKEEGLERFRDVEVFDDDVIVSSLPKGGTTWVAEILFQLTGGIRDDGSSAERDEMNNSPSSLLYPEMLGTEPGVVGLPAGPPIHKVATWDTIFGKPRPRVVSTHLYGKEYLPRQLVDPQGKGKLILVLRNLKDVMISNHFFFGEPKDGWLGNEHGIGSVARFLSTDLETCSPYGNYMQIVKANDALHQSLAPTGRVLVLYYEAMKEDLGGDMGRESLRGEGGSRREVDRMASFLNLPLTPHKCPCVMAGYASGMLGTEREAMLAQSSFEGMKTAMGAHGLRGEHIKANIMRKGQIGDWRNHLDEATWARFDKVYEDILGGVPLAEPLRPYQ